MAGARREEKNLAPRQVREREQMTFGGVFMCFYAHVLVFLYIFVVYVLLFLYIFVVYFLLFLYVLMVHFLVCVFLYCSVFCLFDNSVD